MALTKEQKIGAGLIAGAAVLGIAAYTRRKERLVKCDNISNRTGGTMQEPCPTEGPVDVCTYDGDYTPWRERLGLQLDAIQRLKQNLEDLSLLDESFYDAIEDYVQKTVALISQFPPAWTTESDINPMINQLRTGCDILNQGNRAIVKAGRPEYIVNEAGEADVFAKTARRPSPLWFPLTLVVAGAGAYYLGQRLKRAA